MTQYCPACSDPICSPSGRSTELLIVGDFPSRDDMLQGKLFSSNPNFISAGKILRKELERCGMSIADFRLCSLWMHEPNKNEQCFQAGFNNVLDEAKGKKAILLVGSDVVETFTGYKVSDVSGLQVDSTVLSAPFIYASVSPALAQHRSFGEVRFAIEKFVGRLEKEGLI